jgi:hypothetical protein
MSNPEILNLDEVELPESGIAITHKGETHRMRTVTVEDFIAQQRRAKQVDEAQVEAEAEDKEVTDVVDVVVTIRDQISEMFPTLPVNELETVKLFRIFTWLREVFDKINAVNAPTEAAPADASAEGNVETAGE